MSAQFVPEKEPDFLKVLHFSQLRSIKLRTAVLIINPIHAAKRVMVLHGTCTVHRSRKLMSMGKI